MKKLILIFLVYLAAGFALYGPFLDNPFLMDDEIQVTNNPHVQNISEWPTYFTSSTMDSGGSGKMGGIYFKPFMTIYFASVWHLFPNDPAAFRIPLLVMHVFIAFFIYLFLSRLFDWRLSSALGFLFVLHPVNSEIVAYIADAQDALYMFFGMLGLVLFLGIKRRWLACVALALCTMSALLGKETGALFLAIIPIGAFFFERRKFWPGMATVVSVFAAYMVLRVNSGLLTYEHKVLLIQQASYLERLMTIPLIVWHYIEIFFVPVRISLVTDFAVHELNLEQFWLPLLGDFVFASLVAALWRSLPEKSEERRVYLFSMVILLFWFLLHGCILLPLDGTYADRWFYLAHFACLLLVALAVRKYQFRKTAFALTAVIAVAFAARTYVRLIDWETPYELYSREFKQRPYDALMANNVGFELFHQGKIEEAAKNFEIATQNNPVWDVAWNNLGAANQRLGHLEKALELYKKSVDLGTYYLAYENYASLRCAKSADQECKAFLTKALSLLPQNPRLLELSKAINSQK